MFVKYDFICIKLRLMLCAANRGIFFCCSFETFGVATDHFLIIGGIHWRYHGVIWGNQTTGAEIKASGFNSGVSIPRFVVPSCIRPLFPLRLHFRFPISSVALLPSAASRLCGFHAFWRKAEGEGRHLLPRIRRSYHKICYGNSCGQFQEKPGNSGRAATATSGQN